MVPVGAAVALPLHRSAGTARCAMISWASRISAAGDGGCGGAFSGAWAGVVMYSRILVLADAS